MAVRYCPHCSHEVPAAARFCSKCATTLTPTPSIMPGASPGFAAAPTGVDRVARNARRLVISAGALALFVLAVVVAILAYKLNHQVIDRPPPPLAPMDIAAPTSLTSTDSTFNSVSLSWTASTSGSVTTYCVYNGSALVTTVKETTAKVTGLTPNSSYSFTVVAKDAEGNSSPPSDPLNLQTPGQDQPEPPAGVSVMSATPTSVTLSWTPATDANVTGYEINAGSGTPTPVNGGTTSTATVQGLASNTAYTFTVKARNSNGELSASSTPVSVTTPLSDNGATNTPAPPSLSNIPGLSGTADGSDLPHPGAPVNSSATGGQPATP